MSLIDGIKGNLDSILAVRDTLGVALKPVYLCSTTWSGIELGDGDSTKVVAQILPSPRIVNLSANVKLMEGGVVKEGDIMLKLVSKNLFPNESQIDCQTDNKNVEKYYEVGGVQYQVVKVVEKLLTWDVHLRRRSHQE